MVYVGSEVDLQLQADYDITDFETRLPFVVPPWWEPPLVDIASSKEEAATVHWAHVLLTPTVPKVYTDGSGCFGEIGPSAYCKLLPCGTTFERTAYLGTKHTHNELAAEVAGLILALRLSEEDPRFQCKLEAYSDCQSALRVIHNPRQTSGQYLIREVLRLIDWRREQCWDTSFHWIPAHWEDDPVEGNRHADTLAKRATGWRPRGSTEPRTKAPFLAGLPQKTVQSAANCWVRRKVKQQWENSWASPSTGDAASGRALRSLMPRLEKRGIELFAGMRYFTARAKLTARSALVAT